MTLVPVLTCTMNTYIERHAEDEVIHVLREQALLII